MPVINNLAAWMNCFSGDNDRDVFNEKPSREELISATQVNWALCTLRPSLLCFFSFSSHVFI